VDGANAPLARCDVRICAINFGGRATEFGCPHSGVAPDYLNTREMVAGAT